MNNIPLEGISSAVCSSETFLQPATTTTTTATMDNNTTKYVELVVLPPDSELRHTDEQVFFPTIPYQGNTDDDDSN